MNNKRNALSTAIVLASALSGQTVPDFLTQEKNAVQPYRVIPHDAKTVARRKHNKVAVKERARQRKK